MDSVQELRDIRKKYPHLIQEKPMFFYHLPDNGKLHIVKKIEKHRYYETTMDYLQRIMFKRVRRIRAIKEPLISFSDLFYKGHIDDKYTDARQAWRVMQMAEKLREQTCAIWLDESMTKQERYLNALAVKEAYLENLSKFKLNYKTIRYILNECGGKNQRRLASTLFVTHREAFMLLLERSVEPIACIQRDKTGSIEIYGKRFSLVQRDIYKCE